MQFLHMQETVTSIYIYLHITWVGGWCMQRPGPERARCVPGSETGPRGHWSQVAGGQAGLELVSPAVQARI